MTIGTGAAGGTTSPGAPARGTRPPNRRTLILAAATELFGRQGYDHVGMAEIADAAGIGPSALYRHFPGKQRLLADVIGAGLAPVSALLADLDTGDRAATLPALARLMLDHRDLGVLWQREARHLPASERTALLGDIRVIAARLAELIAATRPELPAAGRDLLAWSVLAVLTSPSFHQVQLPRPGYDALLADLAGRVLDAHLSPLFAAAPTAARPAGLPPRSRREAVLSQAIALFAERSYASVSVEDIAAALGIAGQSVYNHFASKQEMLITAMTRGYAYLQIQLTEALAAALDPADALRRLVRSYVHLAIGHHRIVQLLITDVRNLPEPDLQEILQAQRDHIDEWVHLLRQVHEGLDSGTARITVQATLSVVNDVARTQHLRTARGIEDSLAALCEALLQLPPP